MNKKLKLTIAAAIIFGPYFIGLISNYILTDHLIKELYVIVWLGGLLICCYGGLIFSFGYFFYQLVIKKLL